MQKKAQKYYDQFEIKDRNGETIVIFKDNRDQKLYDSVMEAHGDRLPDDWIFDKYHSILDAIGQYDIETPDDLDNNRSEIVDGLVDVYTSDLTAWLNSSNFNVYYMTEAQEEFGAETDGFKILSMAQYKAIDEIFSEVAELLSA